MEFKNETWLNVKKVLSHNLRQAFSDAELDEGQICEIRIRVGKPLKVLLLGEYVKVSNYVVTKNDVDITYEFICKSSTYTFIDTIKDGFVTISGGHRVGICGKAVIKNGEVATINNITSLNIRIAREVFGVADKILPHIKKEDKVYSTLIVAPPCCGKTTLIRDIARNLNVTTAITDTRDEIAGGLFFDVGEETDVLQNVMRDKGISMLVRTFSPRVVITDELASSQDVEAVINGVLSGVAFIATAHGESIEQIKKNKILAPLIDDGIFEKVIVLNKDFINSGEFSCEDIS